jgi:SpoVK/Ycf46/Vps4 family AAA+-type ATPase
MARLVGSFLTWLQERTAPLYIVATVNRIGGLPPELLRPGRFDACFFCDLPTPEDLAEVLRIHLAKRRQAPERFPAAEVLPKLAGFTPAEVEQVVKAALTRAYAEGARPLEMEDLLAATSLVTPVSVTRAEEIQALRAWAKHRARPASGPGDGSTDVPATGPERRRLTPLSPTR